MPYVNRSLVTTNLNKQFDSNYASSSGVSSSDNLEDDVIVSGRRKSNHRNDWSLPNNQNLNRVKKGYKKPRGLNISVSSSDSDGRQPRVGKILSQQQQQQHRTILSTIPSSITISKQTLPHVGEGSKQIRSNIIQQVPVQPIARSSPKPKQLPQMSRIRPHTPQPSPNAMLKNLHIKTPTSVERKSTHQPAPEAGVAMVISPPPQNEENAFPFTLPPTGDEQTNDEAETTDEDETETETTEEDDEQQQPQQLEQRPQQPQQRQQQYQAVEPIQFFNHREPTPLVKLEPLDPIEELQQMLPPQLPLNPTKQERFICKQQKKLYDYSRRCQLFKEREIGSKMIFRSQLWNSGMSCIIYNNRYSSGEVNDLMMNLQVVSEILYYELRLDYFQDLFDQQQL